MDNKELIELCEYLRYPYGQRSTTDKAMKAAADTLQSQAAEIARLLHEDFHWQAIQEVLARKDTQIKQLQAVVDAARALVSMDGLPSAVQFVLLKEALAAIDREKGPTRSSIVKATPLQILALKEHPGTKKEDWVVCYELAPGHIRTGRWQLVNERGEGDLFFPGHWLDDNLRSANRTVRCKCGAVGVTGTVPGDVVECELCAIYQEKSND